MKEVRNILGWFGMAEEQTILRDAKDHVEETFNTVLSYAEAVRAYLAGDLSAKTAAIEKVRQGEQKADVLKNKMINQLMDSLLLPPDREDLIHFVKTLDKIADWTNGAATLLGFLEQGLPESILKNIAAASELMCGSIAKLKAAIAAFLKNDLKQAYKDCEEVSRLEHDADEQKKKSVESIIRAKLDPNYLLLSYQLSEYMESITDQIQDAADFIKLVAIKSR